MGKLSRSTPSGIRRWGDVRRWSDIVAYRGTAYWVEVAEDLSADTAGQTRQILEQIDRTLEQLGSGRDQLLQVLIYVASLDDMPALNAQWDAWIPAGAAPVRACVQAGL